MMYYTFLLTIALSIKIIADIILDRYITVGNVIVVVSQVVVAFLLLAGRLAFVVGLTVMIVVVLAVIAATSEIPVYRRLRPMLDKVVYDGRRS